MALLIAAPALAAQGVTRDAPDTAQAAAPRRRPPSAPVAATLGLVLPGAGHWYAGETGRGAAIAAVYWTGVAVVAGGRTDAVGQLGGVLAVGAVLTSVIDGVRATERAKRRVHLTVTPGGTPSQRNLRFSAVIQW